MRRAWTALLLVACGPPREVTSAPVLEREPPDASLAGVVHEPDAGVLPPVDAAPSAELAGFESVVVDDALPTDALFQLHVVTNGGYLPATSLLRQGLGEADWLRFTGHWPDAAWALVFRSHPTEAISGTAELYRWKANAWVEVPSARKRQAADYALGTWKNGAIVIVRGDLTGGNMQAGVIPKPIAIGDTGRLGPAIAAAKGFIGRQVVSAPSGELFMAGTRPPDAGVSRPAVAIWSASGAKVRIFDLPAEGKRAIGMWTSDLSLDQLCITSASDGVAVGEEQLHEEREARVVVWRWDGRGFQLSKPAASQPIWGKGCTPDGAVWIGSGPELTRTAKDGTITRYPVRTGATLAITGSGEVFVRLESWFRLLAHLALSGQGDGAPSSY